MKPNIISNVKDNWQRSITAITKHPQGRPTLNGSGKKIATTKLNYGIFSATLASMAQ